jgi:heat shock protein HtpX
MLLYLAMDIKGIFIYVIASLLLMLSFIIFGDLFLFRNFRQKLVKEIKQGSFFDLVRNWSYQLNTPCPKIFVTNDDSSNIFSLRNGREYILVIGKMTLQVLETKELEAVVVCEILKMQKLFMVSKVLEIFIIHNLLIFLDKIVKLKEFSSRRKLRFIKFFLLIAHSIAFFYFYFLLTLLLRLLNIEARIYLADKRTISETQEPYILASAIQKIYNYDKKAENLDIIEEQISFLSFMKDYLPNWLRSYPSADERYQKIIEV